MDEDKLRLQAEKGIRYKALLENPLLIEMWEEMERKIIQGWMDSGMEDKERRDAAFYAVRALHGQKEYMTKWMLTGKAASAKLLEISDPSTLDKIRKVI